MIGLCHRLDGMQFQKGPWVTGVAGRRQILPGQLKIWKSSVRLMSCQPAGSVNVRKRGRLPALRAVAAGLSKQG